MIETPTVLILGAGSSVHAGYPLGLELLSELAGLRGTPATDDIPGWPKEKADGFLARLSRSGLYSIDAFLERSGEEGPLGKFLIARALKKREQVDALFPPKSRNSWYQYLLNRLMKGSGRNEEFDPRNLSVITFNYDRSLEAYLHHALETRFAVSSADAAAMLAAIPIVHVHGILGRYPEIPYVSEATPEEHAQISTQIHIIHELQSAPDGFCNAEFEKSHELLTAAERIFFLGFGFHPENIERFRFFSSENLEGRQLKATAAGLGAIEVEELNTRMRDKYGFTGRWWDGYQCSDFFQNSVAL